MNSLKRGLTLAVAVAALAAPAAANAAITPDPYSTRAGTGRIALQSVLGTSSCVLSNVVATATGTATGATGTILGYTASGCTGFVSAAFFSTAMPFTVVNGNVTLSFSILKRTVLGGNCLYAGTLTGTMPNGGNTLNVSGVKRLIRNLSGGFCDASHQTSVSITLPGASITW